MFKLNIFLFAERKSGRRLSLFALLFGGVFLSTCKVESPHAGVQIVRDFYLSWWDKPNNQQILLSTQTDQSIGSVVVSETVFAVGFDSHFIIAKQHPSKQEEINYRLFGTRTNLGHYEIKDLADTIYLNKNDSIYEYKGRWYHVKEDWNPPDNAAPDKSKILYHIIDLRNYSREKGDSYVIYSFEHKDEFDAKRKELGLPETLTFTIIDKELE